MKKLLTTILMLTTITTFAYDFNLNQAEEFNDYSSMQMILRYPSDQFENPLCVYDRTLGDKADSRPGLGNSFLINMAFGFKLSKITTFPLEEGSKVLRLDIQQTLVDGVNSYNSSLTIRCKLKDKEIQNGKRNKQKVVQINRLPERSGNTTEN